eukprot:TRINITY_DN101232_c0_g1_i1.p1 TRINITY_DN101232_c0_g1~~TRINITY_DN101232_c0_g1_i1.p1  ORF type:complete len:927 (-),score=175.89 TRINITY_DN101232_c0_g1_i1:232-3012(-)
MAREGSSGDLLGLAMTARLGAALLAICCLAQQTLADEVSLGMCYTPYPAKATPDPSQADGVQLPQDDFMSDAAKPLWGPYGRNDLRTIRKLGANHVRMYGNNKDSNHTEFLNYADEVGLKVIAGMSNYPYNQMRGNCNETGLDCYAAVKASYIGNLLRGFTTKHPTIPGAKAYHNALDHFIVINEPDIQLSWEWDKVLDWRSPTAPNGGGWVKGVISAIDGLLDAEKQLNIQPVQGKKLIEFTVTMTFARCNLCIGQDPNTNQTGTARYPSTTRPGLGQMLQLKDGLLNPDKYNYEPRNDLKAFFDTRYFNSLNTGNPWVGNKDRTRPDVACTQGPPGPNETCRDQSVKTLFYDFYLQDFPDTPLYFEEYHSFYQWGYEDTVTDLKDIVAEAKTSRVLRGFNFFEFQLSYGKSEIAEDPGTYFQELFFGLFGLGTYNIMEMDFYGVYTPVQCLAEIYWAAEETKFVPGNNITRAVTEAFGGEGVDGKELCTPNPEIVPLTSVGYASVKTLPDCTAVMEIFVRRVVSAYGGSVPSKDKKRSRKAYLAFIQRFCAMPLPAAAASADALAAPVERRLASDDDAAAVFGSQFAQLNIAVGARPAWAYWPNVATCVADRKSNSYAVGRTVDVICSHYIKYFQCQNVPKKCRKDNWRLADYVLSVYFNEVLSSKDDASPLASCYFNGTAEYLPQSELYEEDLDEDCIVSQDPVTTALTDEGFAAVRRQDKPMKTAAFVMRIIDQYLNATVCNADKLKDLAKDPELSIAELVMDLRESWWICDGNYPESKPCPASGYCPKPMDWWEVALRTLWLQVLLGVLAMCICGACVATCLYARQLPDESADWQKKHLKECATGAMIPQTSLPRVSRDYVEPQILQQSMGQYSLPTPSSYRSGRTLGPAAVPAAMSPHASFQHAQPGYANGVPQVGMRLA